MKTLNFQDLPLERAKIIQQGYTDPIKNNEKENILASILHPDLIKVKVSKIKKENENTKSFYLAPLDGELPPFEAGQYVTLQVKINNGLYKRAYSISSSPTTNKEYRLTIKRRYQGTVSNFLFNEGKVDDILQIEGPFGLFTYNALRDDQNVLALCGGIGITSIMALAYACAELNRPESLTILYGAKTEKDLVFKKELDELREKYHNLKVRYILSEEKRDDYEYGFIDSKRILNEEPFTKSIFVSGPEAMNQSLNEILKDLDIPNKYIRVQINKEIPEELGTLKHELHIKTANEDLVIPCYENETLLKSMEKFGINAPVHCTAGVCGFCLSKLISGKIKTENSHLTEYDQKNDYFHPCVTYPKSDVTIKLPIK